MNSNVAQHRSYFEESEHGLGVFAPPVDRAPAARAEHDACQEELATKDRCLLLRGGEMLYPFDLLGE